MEWVAVKQGEYLHIWWDELIIVGDEKCIVQYTGSLLPLSTQLASSQLPYLLELEVGSSGDGDMVSENRPNGVQNMDSIRMIEIRIVRSSTTMRSGVT